MGLKCLSTMRILRPFFRVYDKTLSPISYEYPAEGMVIIRRRTAIVRINIPMVLYVIFIYLLWFEYCAYAKKGINDAHDADQYDKA